MWEWFVYLHRKADSGEPFYVGKGRIKKRTHERAFSTDNRTKYWRHTVSKHGRTVEIIASCVSNDEALKLEASLIREIGRRDLGTGPLVNLTDGGQGPAGIVPSVELLKKRSVNASKPRTQAWIDSIRISRKNGGNGGVVKRGDKLPTAWKQSIARTKIGDRNPCFGKPTATSKRVINTATGVQYDSIARAAAAEGINAKTLYQYLNGVIRNRTSLVRL